MPSGWWTWIEAIWRRETESSNCSSSFERLSHSCIWWSYIFSWFNHWICKYIDYSNVTAVLSTHVVKLSTQYVCIHPEKKNYCMNTFLSQVPRCSILFLPCFAKKNSNFKLNLNLLWGLGYYVHKNENHLNCLNMGSYTQYCTYKTFFLQLYNHLKVINVETSIEITLRTWNFQQHECERCE